MKLKQSNIKTLILLTAITILAIAAFVLPVRDWLIKILEWTQSLGFWGPLFVAGFYVIACILFLPGSVLTIGSGFIFKLMLGTIIVSIGSTMGAAAAFLVGRTLARNWVAAKISENPKFTAIDQAVANQGFKIVLLTRLSPVFPFNLLNYAFGLTKVSFSKYVLASWIGMLPGTVMYVYIGAGLRSITEIAADNVETTAQGRILFWFGLIATVVVTILITRIARKAIKQAVTDK